MADNIGPMLFGLPTNRLQQIISEFPVELIDSHELLFSLYFIIIVNCQVLFIGIIGFNYKYLYTT